MRRKPKITFLGLLITSTLGSGLFLSCQKEISCEDCRETNKPPIAVAGPDQVITLPIDSIALDGSASSDPDGKIIDWLWEKISGPASFSIASTAAAKTVVRTVVNGVYRFELRVKDDGGLSAKDTIQIVVNSATAMNHPPVANAGNDTLITLPANVALLDGSRSSDPDSNITSYVWTKISGPSSSSFNNPNAAYAQATNLVEGVYEFELKVTDADGLFDKDTARVTVVGQQIACDNSSRPVVNARLIPFGRLSEDRWWISVASADNKIVFAGGIPMGSNVVASSRVDIYDIATQTWATAELSVARYGMATVTAGSKIFFAGGGFYDSGFDWNFYSAVDIYDAATNTWSAASLSEARTVTGGIVGNKVFFASGWKEGGSGNMSDKMDVYDLTTDTWSTELWSAPRAGMVAVTAGDKTYFAGGATIFPDSIFRRIDVYDNGTNSWSSSSLSEPKTGFAGIAVGNKIYWAGGLSKDFGNTHPSCLVEVQDVNTGASSITYLSEPRVNLNAAVKDNKIVFLRHLPQSISNDYFDIYDISSGTWSIGRLPTSPIPDGGIISVNNTIYVTSLWQPGIPGQIWKLEF